MDVELRQEGYSEKELEDIRLAVNLILLDFFLARAPLTSKYFIRALEVVVTLLKFSYEETKK